MAGCAAASWTVSATLLIHPTRWLDTGAFTRHLSAEKRGDAVTRFVLDDFLPYQLAVLANRVSRDFSRLYRSRYGISIAEWRIVAHLSQAQGPVSVGEICRRVELEKSKVSRAASRLHEKGFVLKVPSQTDRRLVELSLTEAGHDMIRTLAPLAASFQEELLQSLGPRRHDFTAALREFLQPGDTS